MVDSFTWQNVLAPKWPSSCKNGVPNNHDLLCTLHASTPCFYTLFLHPVSTPCFYTLFLHPVSTPCFYTLFLHPVSTPCFYTLFLHPVSTPCFYTMFLHPVSTPGFLHPVSTPIYTRHTAISHVIIVLEQSSLTRHTPLQLGFMQRSAVPMYKS